MHQYDTHASKKSLQKMYFSLVPVEKTQSYRKAKKTNKEESQGAGVTCQIKSKCRDGIQEGLLLVKHS